MKGTGIVRRIDDLGRVIIPKEIRRTLGIREGDPLEIFTDPDERAVYFKPYLRLSPNRGVCLKMPPMLCVTAMTFTSSPPMFTNLRAK